MGSFHEKRPEGRTAKKASKQTSTLTTRRKSMEANGFTRWRMSHWKWHWPWERL